MKVYFSKPCDPHEWRTEGGAVWVGHTKIAVLIVKGLQQLERFRLWLRRARQEN